MESFILLAVFLFGVVVGSFLNVVSLRLRTGMTLNGRSQCFSCGKTLRWSELIPIMSFLLQRGRCRGCRAKVSRQYPAGEIISGAFFLIAWLSSASVLQFAWLAILLSLLHVIFFYDLRHTIIPDGFVWAFNALALLGTFVHFGTLALAMPSLPHLLAGPVLALPFALIWLFSGGRAMGLGDAKLALGLGWMLGLPAGASAIIAGFWLAALAVLPLLVLSRRGYAFRRSAPRLTMKSEVPLGPFLILGAAAMLAFPLDLLRLGPLFGL